MNQSWEVVILAAGQSSRMGKIKALLELPGGATFIENIICQYNKAGCTSIHLVVGKELEQWLSSKGKSVRDNVYIVRNDFPEKGRMYSIQTGLQNCMMDRPVFIHNVDNPFVESELISSMVSGIKKGYWVKPTFREKGGHPVLLSVLIIKKILEQPFSGKSLKEFLSTFPVLKMETDWETVMLNINTPEDYEKLLQSLVQHDNL